MKYKLQKSDPELNLAPMIDVVFLLLIFFIVGSTLNINEVKTTITLPETGVVQEKNTAGIEVVISREGKIFFAGRELDLSGLEEELRERITEVGSPQVQVSLYADKQVDFQSVIRVMDVVKKLEVANLSFSLINRGP